MEQTFEIPAWMGDVDPSQIGFPFPIDKARYEKRTGIAYKQTDSGPLRLDAYRPASGDAHPLVVMIHGGGWARGGRFEMGLSKWAGYLATAGLCVVSIDYRLAPATHYPDSFQDCLDAVDWVVQHAAELGADADRIGLWGDSAGGHLVLLLALSQTRPDFTGPRMKTAAQSLGAAVAFYPPTDLLRLHRAELRGGAELTMVRSFLGAAPDEEPDRWREASPIEQVHAAAPPLLLLQGTRDLLVPHRHIETFTAKLTEAGARHELHIVVDGVHGFDRVAPGPQSKSLIERSREFLLENLGA
jgi:acetyl esterase/lipase